jgi:hypothetical protein
MYGKLAAAAAAATTIIIICWINLLISWLLSDNKIIKLCHVKFP